MHLSSIITFISDNQTVSALVAFWLGSNIVSALPSPDQSSGKPYKFVFSLAHGLAGSLPRLLPNLRLPGDPTRGTATFFGPPVNKP